tara:strand:- start:287 stop:610 length:324 start_codon:yes stop_codon:yes gene_type:complete
VYLRVNITYSVELDDVPDEVARILEECEQNFRRIHGQLDQTIGREPLELVAELDKIRVSLARLDLKLGDSMDILSGYIQTMAQKPKMEQDMMSTSPEESEVIIDEDV